MELGLKGKVALITGGSKGIGLAIKKALELEGAKVISWSRTDGIDLTDSIPKLPPIDILINNFGGAGRAYNLVPMYNNFEVMANLINQFIQFRNWGRVITISSIFGKEKGINPYFTAAKSAQIAFMKSMAGKHHGITFNTICPGHIDVDKGWTGGKPEDVAWIVAFLCSEKAGWINGATITVDNGESHSF